jgi:hypothetical protein
MTQPNLTLTITAADSRDLVYDTLLMTLVWLPLPLRHCRPDWLRENPSLRRSISALSAIEKGREAIERFNRGTVRSLMPTRPQKGPPHLTTQSR